MDNSFYQQLEEQLRYVEQVGLYKKENAIISPQQAQVTLTNNKQVLNFCSNNYLGLANHPAIIAAAKEALTQYGFGIASVRFICGTHVIHQQLEKELANFLGTEDALLFSSGYIANCGLFESLFDENDIIISDALNHTSLIDGIKLSHAKYYLYANNNIYELEKQIIRAKTDGARNIAIVTNGVFSMDGVIADLNAICHLAKRYHALVIIDDCHSVGVIGENGRGTHEYCHVMDQVDVLTGTLGKALGGSLGGYIAGRKKIISWLRQNSRPYLLSNSLPPSIVHASLTALQLLQDSQSLRTKLEKNSLLFRKKMTEAGFTLLGANHPIIPILIKDEKLAQDFASDLLQEGIYVASFCYPIVPKNQARIRAQMSSVHSKEQIHYAINSFIRIGKRMKIIR